MAGETILLIDTDTDTIQQVSSVLESRDYLVFTASSAEDSLLLAERVRPLLIFINLEMSDSSSLEICKAIHNIEDLKTVPFVVITPHAGRINPRHTSLYGIVDTLRVPFTPEELVSKTEKVFSQGISDAEVVEEALVGDEIFEAEEEPGTGDYDEIEVEAATGEELYETREEGADTGQYGEIRADRSSGGEEEFDFQEDIGFGEPDVTASDEEGKHEVFGESAGAIPPFKKEVTQLGRGVMNDGTEKDSVGADFDEEAFKEKSDISAGDADSSFGVEPYVHEVREETGTKRRKRKKNRVPLVAGIALFSIILIGTIIFALLNREGPLPWENVPEPVVDQYPGDSQQGGDEPVQPQDAAELDKTAGTPDADSATGLEESAQQQVVIEDKQALSSQPGERAAEKGFHAVQIGAFRNRDMGESFARTYREKGYEAFLHEGTSKGKKTLYRVLIGKFESRGESARLAETIQSKEKIPVTLYRE